MENKFKPIYCVGSRVNIIGKKNAWRVIAIDHELGLYKVQCGRFVKAFTENQITAAKLF